ncbi:Sugar transporter STL1 [Hypsizygus marmoreus]|uniref:Sugar transporter STL1 n=1 Tax=Hypsizygus marmoreus TaxID=39966 RepID=A0A369J0K3_HYPMA|nr:Sugar transporter STL1 [Hypsizygus marmoreus]
MPTYPKPRRRLVGQSLLYSISVFASLGVFLFGYDQGVMSGIITGPHFIKYFNTPGPVELGTMVSVLEIGAFATSIAAGRVGDVIGRKGTLFIGGLVFTFGGVIQTFTIGFWSMVFGRIISGFGVGLLSTIVPIYQSEISPPNHRGALACVEFTGNIVGYAFSVWTDYFCSFIDSNLAWRIPLFIQCIIGGILAGGSLFIPESPRWLIDTDKDGEGMQVLVDLNGGDLDNTVAKAEFQEIKDKVLFERRSGEDRTYSVMWRKYKRRVLLAMSSQAFAQLNGINVISYYAPRVFEQAGWIGREAILMTGVNAIIYVLSTLPPWYLVDRWGRRPILLSGAAVMSVALAATGFWISLDVPWTPSAVVVSVIIYNAAFGYSWGPIPWLYPPEIMPLTVRAKGVSLSTCTNWAFNYIVGAGTPWLQDVIHWRLYFMHAFFCVCSFILVYFLYPETKGVPLEDMDAVFGEAPEKTNNRSSASPTENLELGSYPPEPPTKQTVGFIDRWLGRLSKYLAPRNTSYRSVESEELAPLHSGYADEHARRRESGEHSHRNSGDS